VISAPPITAALVSVIRPVTEDAPDVPCPKSSAVDIRRQKTHSSQSDSFLIMSLSPLTKLQISQLTEFRLLYANPRRDVNDPDKDILQSPRTPSTRWGNVLSVDLVTIFRMTEYKFL